MCEGAWPVSRHQRHTGTPTNVLQSFISGNALYYLIGEQAVLVPVLTEKQRQVDLSEGSRTTQWAKQPTPTQISISHIYTNAHTHSPDRKHFFLKRCLTCSPDWLQMHVQLTIILNFWSSCTPLQGLRIKGVCHSRWRGGLVVSTCCFFSGWLVPGPTEQLKTSCNSNCIRYDWYPFPYLVHTLTQIHACTNV